MRRTPRRGEFSGNGGSGDERIHVNLSIRRQVWTLARQRFANVSRLVERLLEVALGLEPSLQMVVIPNSERGGSSAWESAGLKIRVSGVQIPLAPPFFQSGGSLAWSRTPAFQAGNPGSNPGHRTKICFWSLERASSWETIAARIILTTCDKL